MDVTEAVDHAPRSRGLVLGAAVVVAVIMVALVVVLATRDPAQDRVDESPLVGHVAPPLVGEVVAPEATAGSQFDLDRLRGQWVVVNFFATWCVPCVTEHPELIEFSDRHAATGDASVASVVFDADENVDDIADFFADKGGDWPVVDGEDVILDWAVAAVPESFLVSPDGVVAAKITGGVTADGLDDLIAEVQQP
ncbi:MAG TPA: TlpA disulfide reductase family protein [Actinomycetota bacterium]|nr:TlpA disulfide reductase family protein [Actinomycetota bacterium]